MHNKKKVILVRYHNTGNINTRLPESLNRVQGVLPPLGIAYIAAVLEKNGITTQIIDAPGLNMTSQEFKEAIQREKPDIVGIACMTSNIHGALEAAKICKENGAITVLGGPQLAVYPEETVSYPYVDFGIIGEGEYSMLKLVQSIEAEKDISSIRGLIYKKGKKIITNEAQIIDNLDELPFPAYHLLPMNRYSSVIGLHPVCTMITSRGCPYQCGFCFKQPTDKRFRMRSPKNIVDEMEYLIKKYGVKEIMFYDDTISVMREHVEGICKEIINRELKIKWESPTRIDLVDEELLKLMKKAGCIRLRYGVESGDPVILKLMNKQITLDRAVHVFDMTRKIGIESFAYFIIGYITETPETMQRTIDFAKKLDSDFAMFTIATPYPKTSLFSLSVERKLIDPDYWKKFVLSKDVGRMPYLVPDAEKWMKKAYRSFYLRPRFILRKVLQLKSINALKKYVRGAWGLVWFSMTPDQETND